MQDSKLREVYSADNSQEAHLVKAALEEVGIEARVVGDHLVCWNCQAAHGEHE